MIRLRPKPIPRLLHGTLFATIYDIDKLQYRHGPLSCSMCGVKLVDKIKQTLCGSENAGPRIYVTINLDKAKVAETRIIANKYSNLMWDQSFRIYCAHTITDVIFTIKQENPIGAREIGKAKVLVEDIIRGFIVERRLDIVNDEGQPFSGNPKIHVMLQFISINQDHVQSRGLLSPKLERVAFPHAFFNQRDGCMVTLYQDAHVPDSFSPRIRLKTGQYDVHRHCWEDIFDAINGARHLVYVTGWSVYTEITLVRDPNRPRPGIDVTLGELLKRKADEGLMVLMLVWDFGKFFQKIKVDTQMHTHAEETKAYFQNTRVHCLLCPRHVPAYERSNKVRDLEFSALFTHHQKSVVVDAEMPGAASKKRRIVSFIGGIDLCDGRYDTPEHPLFKTLDTVHQEDFHQPNFPGASIKKGGPREPWHDIHCRLEGPVAWDVLYNFEQRWQREVGNDFLIPPHKLHEILVNPLTALPYGDTETWNVQVFRSIDGSEAYGFPRNPEDAAEVGLVGLKDNVVDRSIQDAYINAIRRAKNFIYIENQYFIGSSFAWRGSTIGEVEAFHLIPRELSLKIVSKIDAGERFVVYIVIPMWPEGIPESDSVQEMLDWQRRTMEMMYTDIAEALKRKKIKTDPREYLTFFCLGNREAKRIGEYTPPEAPEADSDYGRAQHSRRFMIYVHAKMMIGFHRILPFDILSASVDDEYIIVGSANINQRSMDGARDTEIAMGAFQPYHLASKQQPKGQIHGFRLALWHEHLGGLVNDSFPHPESVDCVRLLNWIADNNWEEYASASFNQGLQGHLLKYPIKIESNGTVTSLQGNEHFPDTTAPVLGRIFHTLPPVITT